jgi:multidrug resistance efflux pump
MDKREAVARAIAETDPVYAEMGLLELHWKMADAALAADRIEELEAELKKAVEALEPYADLAKHHAADAPEWRPFDSVPAQVSIRNLRDARATLEELKGNTSD